MAIPGPQVSPPFLAPSAFSTPPVTRAHPDSSLFGLDPPSGDEDERTRFLRLLLSPPTANVEGQQIGDSGMVVESPKDASDHAAKKAAFSSIFSKIGSDPALGAAFLQLAGALLQPIDPRRGENLGSRIGQGLSAFGSTLGNETARQRQLAISERRDEREEARFERQQAIEGTVEEARADKQRSREIQIEQLRSVRNANDSALPPEEKQEAQRLILKSRRRKAQIDALTTPEDIKEEISMQKQLLQLRVKAAKMEAEDSPLRRKLEMDILKNRAALVEAQVKEETIDPKKLISKIVMEEVGEDASPQEVLDMQRKIERQFAEGMSDTDLVKLVLKYSIQAAFDIGLDESAAQSIIKLIDVDAITALRSKIDEVVGRPTTATPEPEEEEVVTPGATRDFSNSALDQLRGQRGFPSGQ